MERIIDYIKLIRVKHWVKNLLVFLPLVFSKNLFNGILFNQTLSAFIIFCLISSIIYIFNDLNDIEKDKKHPEKKKRPLPSGRISVKAAYITLVILALLSGVIIVLMSKQINIFYLITVPTIYLILNVLYTKVLKNIAIVDVFIIVLGFLLRTLYGSLVTSIEISNGLYLMIIFLSFYLGFGKRRNEIIKNGTKSRKSLEKYNKDFLDKNMYMCLSLSIISYSLWSVDPKTIARVGNNYLIWSILILMAVLFCYSLDIENDSSGDPVEVLLNNKVLCALALIFCIYIIVVLYVV